MSSLWYLTYARNITLAREKWLVSRLAKAELILARLRPALGIAAPSISEPAIALVYLACHHLKLCSYGYNVPRIGIESCDRAQGDFSIRTYLVIPV